MDDRVTVNYTMFHSGYVKNRKIEEVQNYEGKEIYGIVSSKFYPIADLRKDGFIHADGSLRFEFRIKK